MNSQLSLALVVTLCLSNAQTFKDSANSDLAKSIQHVRSNKAFMDALRLILNMADDHTSSEGTLPPTQPVISQPTVTTDSSKPLTSTQPVATQTTTKETSTKPLSSTQPLISQPTASIEPWTSTQPVASQTTTNSNISITTTEDGANSDLAKLIQHVRSNKAFMDVLRLMLKVADDHTSSEGTLPPTQPVIPQPTVTIDSSKPLTSTQPVATQTKTKETSTKPLSSTQPLISQPTYTTASSKPWTSTQPVASQTTINSNVSRNDNNTTEDVDTDDKFESSQLSHHSINFPVLFMLILLIVVAGYFGYHNRAKIHRFIKEGYGKVKQTGTAYVKVKLEDDIELTHEANRQYVY